MSSAHRRPLARLLAPFLLFALPAAACAQDAAPRAAAPATAPDPGPAPAPAKPQVKAKPALWKVADKDTTIWLFGTIHILPPGIAWYDGPVAKALESSDTLVTEVVEPEDPAVAQQIARIALSDPPRNLREQLPAQERAKYEAALTSLHVPVSAFDANDPWYAAVALSTLPLIQAGFGTMNGAEALLVAKAREKGMARLGLETAQMQLGLFDSLPQETQIGYLGDVLESFPKVREEVGAMLEAWKSGKADTLAQLMNEDQDDPQLMKVLLVDRNKAWAKWIEERLKRPGTVFIAVGAGHLAGKNSVQAQLAADRVKTKRVR